MRNVMILLATLLLVIAGLFLPEFLLKRNAEPEIRLDYEQVTVTSQTSSDYVWRMQQISEHYFGEGEHQLTTFISGITPYNDDSDVYSLFTNELNKLIAAGAVPVSVGKVLSDNRINDDLDYQIRYYYLFDSETVSGFRIAEFAASDLQWNVAMCLDLESGKLARVKYGGSQLIPGGAASPIGNSGWYDMLRSYADYLGLSAAALAETPEQLTQYARQYFESCTADRLASRLSSNGSAWMELRALRENYSLTLAVYNGGK